jgi:arsenate reductase-like glutaredoxin family protein
MVFYDRMTVRNYDKNIHIPQLLSCRKVKNGSKNNKYPLKRGIFLMRLRSSRIKRNLIQIGKWDRRLSFRNAVKIVKEKKVNVEDMTISEMISFIREKPSVLKRPIVVNDRRIQVGYNEEKSVPSFRRLAAFLKSIAMPMNAPISTHAHTPAIASLTRNDFFNRKSL